MKRKFGWFLVVLFGLTMLTEVAVLPLFSSFASKFENSVIAELTDFEDQEKLESLADLQLATIDKIADLFFYDIDELKHVNGNPKNPDVGLSTEVFLKNRVIRI
jgi:hypothetical protein